MACVRFRQTRRRQYQLCQQFNCDFDFERLPDYLFIRILGQLEFRQRFNIARVNRRFKEMSDVSVTMVDSFDFDAKFPDVDTFRQVVGKFARYLQAASVYSTVRFDAISDLEFPRLADFELDGLMNQVSNFLTRCPNLRRLKIRHHTTIDGRQSVFPPVESVEFSSCGWNVIERVLAACPNVKHFSMDGAGSEIWQFVRRLNQFFSDRVNSMESMSLEFCHGYWDPLLLHEEFENLWHLRSLRVLKIDLYDMTFNDMDTISTSFPNLRVLHLVTWRLDGYVSTLSKLKNLVDLELFAYNGLCDIDIWEFVKTSEARGLKRFEINGKFSLSLVMDIIERFPRLKNLTVRRLLNEDSTCSAISNFAKRLRQQFARRDLKIVLFAVNEMLSESRRVRRAMEKLRRAAGGDERRPGLVLDVCDVYDGGSLRGFRKRAEKMFVRLYHRLFC